MEEDYTSLLASLGVQGLPTEQPVQTMTEYAPLDLGDWNLGMVNTGPLNLLSDPGGAYEPNAVVRFDTGTKIGVPDGNGGFIYQNAAPVVAQPNTTYTLTDTNQNILGTGATVEELQKLAALADQNASGGWNLYSGAPVSGGQLFDRSPVDNTLLYAALAAAAAMGGGALLGVGAGTGGTAAGTVAAGSGAGAAGTTAGTLAGTAAGTTAATTAGTAAGLAPLVGPGWTVLAPAATGLTTTGAVLGGSTLAGALAAAAANPGPVNYADQVWGDQSSAPTGSEQNLSYVDPTTGDIVVPSGTTTFPMDPNSILAGFLGSQFPPLTSVDIPPGAGTQLPDVPADTPPEGTGPDIVATAPKPVLDASAAIIPALTSVAIPPLAGTTLPSTGPSTLDQILKYYTLGSGLLDALGVGQPKTGTATPYTSALGPMPKFSRGNFTPFTGDYERYAFGPEWSFFGGAAPAAGTPTTGAAAGTTGGTTTGTIPAGLLPAATATAAPTALTSEQKAAELISAMTAANTAKAPTVTVPGLTPAQQLYLNSIAANGTPTAEEINYVKNLSDYQALASLANTQSMYRNFEVLNDGYKTASNLSSYYGTPVTSM